MNQGPDLYKSVHKGLRAAMHAQLVRLGRLDPSDPSDVSETLAELRDLLVWMEDHLHIEEEYVHKALAARRPAALLTTLRHNHDDHGRAFALLRTDVDALESASRSALDVRQALAHHLYLEFTRFVGENLVHMALEETDLNALLWEVFTPAELAGIFSTIIASERPEQLQRSLKWVIPSLCPEERAQLIGNARIGLDPQVFDGLLQFVALSLPANDWDKLSRALGN